jgi:hypothetical protein
MHPKLFYELHTYMARWMDEAADSGDAPPGIVGDDTALLMAKAAGAVYDAVFDVQKTGLEDGYYELVDD